MNANVERFETFVSDKFKLQDAQDYINLTLGISISKENEIVIRNEKLLPKLSYEHNTDRFCLSYLGPDNIGMQYFYFDGNNFCSCYNEIGNENLDSFFFRFHANSYVRLIFFVFQINITSLRKAYRQNKKLKRKVVLKVKKMNLFWVFDRKRYNLSGVKEKTLKTLNLTQEELEELNVASDNMLKAVKLAKQNYDLNYFNQYYDNLIIVSKLTKKPIPNFDKALKLFKDSVANS